MRHRAQFIIIMMIISLLSLSGCSTRKSAFPTAGDNMVALLASAEHTNYSIAQEQMTIPLSVQTALIPKIDLQLPEDQSTQEVRFDISVNDSSARLFFMGLTHDTDYSMIVSPSIEGTITLDLKNVTIEDVLQTTQSVYGYEYRRTSHGFEILSNTLTSRVFNVNSLNIERFGSSQTQISSGQTGQSFGSGGNSIGGVLPGIGGGGAASANSSANVTTLTRHNFWQQLHTTIIAMIGQSEGRSVVINPQGGLVVVRAYPKELRQIADYLDYLQASINRQVILEVKILEVALNDTYQAGIDWSFFGGSTHFDGASFFPEASRSSAKIKWIPKDFETTIHALETQGNVQVLSSPRVSTMNNQKAVIKVGKDEFFVTGLSSTSGAVGEGNTQDVELTSFFSGITLDVTPQINPDGGVTLHVKPAVSLVKDGEKEVDLGNEKPLKLPTAVSSVRESDTIVYAEDGQVVVIAGLMKHESTEQIEQLPFFGHIPYLGALFRSTRQEQVKSELVILIRPIVMDNHNWGKELSQLRKRLEENNKGFHFGSRPDLFGTEAEKPMPLGPKVNR